MEVQRLSAALLVIAITATGGALAPSGAVAQEALATDNFNRVDQNPLAGNWTSGPSTFEDLQLVSNAVRGVVAGTQGVAYYNAITWPNDQWSEVTITGLGGGDGGPAVRISENDKTAYMFAPWGSGTYWVLGKYVNGVFTELASGSASFAVGDVVRLEVQSTTLRAFKNGALITSTVDASILSGNAGIFIFDNYSGLTFDDWAGGAAPLAVDIFSRANENPLAGSWTSGPGGFGNLELFSSSVRGVTDLENFAYYNAVSWPSNQWSEVKIAGLAAGPDGGVAVRLSATTKTAYVFVVYGTGTWWEVGKIVNGTYTKLIDGAGTFVLGDMLRLEVHGVTLRAYKNGNLLTSITDGAISAGNAGIFVWDNNTGLNFDDWAGGEPIQPPPTPPAPVAPTNLVASAAASTQINLTWTDNSTNEDGFRIERCAGAGCGNFAEVATVVANVANYADIGLATATSYSYRVRAYNGGGTSAYSNTATAALLAGLASDNFNRPNENPLGGSWTSGPAGFGNLELFSNSIRGVSDFENFAYYNAVTWPDDHWSEVRIASLTAGPDGGAAVRISATTKTAYVFVVFGTGNWWEVGKIVNGVYTGLTSGGATFAVNDVLRLEAQGTTLRAFRNGGLLTSVTDATIASGNAGLFVWDNVPGFTFDDWAGGAAGPPVPPVVALFNHNPDNQDRSYCLTVAAGDAAAVQCGDLLAFHSMPAFRSMGQDRSLTLVYNSATAEPRPRVVAEVSIPAGAQEPVDMYAELTVNAAIRASAKYSAWTPGETRNIALAFDASTFATGWYPFTLLVRSNYPGSTHDGVINDTLIIVNRGTSEFGAGWHPGGVERLVLGQPGGSILWVGGDGSAKVYRSIGVGQWQAPSGGFRDLIVQAGSTYERRGKHGVTVTFDDMGRHIRTRNRLGHVTTFTWDPISGRLTQITVPGPGGGD